MLGINGKQWNDIQWTDVEEFLNEIEESFFFEFKKDEVSGAKLIKEIAALANTYGTHLFSVRSPASRPSHGDYPHQQSERRKGVESRWHYFI